MGDIKLSVKTKTTVQIDALSKDESGVTIKARSMARGIRISVSDPKVSRYQQDLTISEDSFDTLVEVFEAVRLARAKAQAEERLS